MTHRRIIKDRACGWCDKIIKTDGDGLIEHSMKEHGTVSPPSPERFENPFKGLSETASLAVAALLASKGGIK